jgi:DNA gyrase subunit B
VCRDGKIHFIEFNNKDKYHDTKNGSKVKPLTIIGDVTDKKTGTTIEFFPDFSIMETFPFDHTIIAARLQQLAYLNKGLKIIFIDQIQNSKNE